MHIYISFHLSLYQNYFPMSFITALEHCFSSLRDNPSHMYAKNYLTNILDGDVQDAYTFILTIRNNASVTILDVNLCPHCGEFPQLVPRSGVYLVQNNDILKESHTSHVAKLPYRKVPPALRTESTGAHISLHHTLNTVYYGASSYCSVLSILKCPF